MNPTLLYLLRSLGLAAVYFGVAFAMTLLQPPSYALPVFPSIGIALAALLVYGAELWPSVWSGAFLFFLYDSFRLSGAISPESVVAGAAVGLGATLQTLIGAFLIRKIIGFPNPLERPGDIATFFALGGPIAGVVSPSLSLAALHWLGFVEESQLSISWRDWWIGDSIGVFVAAPLTLILIASPREVWRPRLVSVALPLLATGLIFIWLTLQVETIEREELALAGARMTRSSIHFWLLFISGMLFTGLLGCFLLVLSGNARRTHQLVQERTKELNLSARVFESSGEGIMITDADNRIISVNPAFTSITGYTRGEVLGKNPRILASGEHEPGFFASMWASLAEEDRWQGEMWNRRKNGEIFPQWTTISVARNEQGEILNYIASFADISQQKLADEHIHHLAYFDALTGLANRSLLKLRGEQAIMFAARSQAFLGVLFMDLDRFKTINDSLGHVVGDRLLQTVALRLRGCVREEDTVARLGGDEFVVILANLGHREDAALVARKIINVLARSLSIDEHELTVTCSIGISIYPNDGETFEALVKNADTAMYKAKDEGRNNFQFFEPAMSAQLMDRLMLENALRRALERHEFELNFQPQVDMATGWLVGAEALLRWQHPEMGAVIPDRFISLAEETGLIVEIGNWVIAEVCRQLGQWRSEGVQLTTISVNISALQFKRPDLVDFIRDTLELTSVPSRLLELELTESILMSSAEESVRTLEQLHLMGVRLSIDDFGTGYSSLSYLKRLPIHKLKIDRSFIHDIPDDPNDAAITRTIVGLANNLHLRVIAEGVETAAQHDFLQALGCHEVQGSYIAAPMSAVEFKSWLQRIKNWRVTTD